MAFLRIACCMIGLLCLSLPGLAEPVTVLVPSQPYLDHKTDKKTPEVDILMALMEPYDYISQDMDRPQFLAAMYYAQSGRSGAPELINLLGDIEEIRYNGKKAWGVNVAIPKPGLYQFVLEAKPWWNEAGKNYLHQQAKVALPVNGGCAGWEASFGQSLEILPLTRPYGLTAPTLFSGKIQLDGKPLANLTITMGRLNPGRAKASTQWDTKLEARSNANGEFAFVLKDSGWWYCEASIPGAPLKGPDGEMSEVVRSTVLWLYVDGIKPTKK